MIHILTDPSPLTHFPSGISVYARGLLCGLAGLADRVRVIPAHVSCRAGPDREIRSALARLQVPQALFRARLPYRMAATWPRLCRWMARLPRIDIVHALGNAPDVWLPIGAERLVLTVHDVGFLYPPERGYSPPGAQETLAKRLREWAPRSAAFLAVSQFTKQEMVHLLGIPPERIFVSPQGPQWEEGSGEGVSTRIIDKHGLTPERYWLAVGHVNTRKNYDTLLAAFDRFRKDEPTARLVVVGRYGWGAERVVERLRASRGEIVWMEDIAAQDLRVLYRSARGLVFASWYEGFGIPALEAMACGCPVIHSAGGAIQEMMGDAGIPVPPAEPEAIAEAMARLWADDRLATDLRRRGKLRAREFSWKRAAEATFQAYRFALEHAPA